MTQAQFQAIIMEVKILKAELKRYMSTTELEKQNLEAHVDLCSERYKGLHDRLSAIEMRLGKMHDDQDRNHKSHTKTIIAIPARAKNPAIPAADIIDAVPSVDAFARPTLPS